MLAEPIEGWQPDFRSHAPLPPFMGLMQREFGR